ncbi:MAG: beta-lactamase family protein [Firmicutes bacterium]|nr:beta-lactamase family protein [Bacillota bacterium]
MDTRELDFFLEKKVEELKLAGVAVAVRGPEGVLFEKGYGYRDKEMTTPPDGNTIFGIASMSKSMAALACAILATEGKLSLEDPVSKYVPGFHVPGNPDDAVTIRSLAMHTTGIPPMEPLEWSIAMNTPGRNSEEDRQLQASAPNRMDSIEQIIDYIANCPYPTLGAPGEYMSYSNEGYAVLCSVVDAATGMTPEDFLDQRVFSPIGMTRTTLDLDGSRARAIASDGNISSLFDKRDGKWVADDIYSTLPPFRACACVKSTVHDMARYYQCLSNGGIIDGVQALPAGAAELMVGAAFPEQEKAFYCLGLNKRVLDGHVICEHSGGLHGVSSEGGFLKGENYGVTVLCNEGGCDVSSLLWACYNWIMGRDLEKNHRWLYPKEVPFSAPEMLTGRYICHEGNPAVLRIFIENGALYAENSNGKMEMAFCGQTWFQLLQNASVMGRLRFHIRNGKAWGVQVYTRVYQRLDDSAVV